MPTLGWDARLPQRRPGPLRRRGAALRRPGRRPGQARRPPDRARRDRQRAARGCPGVHRRAAAAVRTTEPGNQLLVGYLDRRRGVRRRGGDRELRRDAAGRAGAPAGRGRRRCRPAPRARSTATRCPGRCPAPGDRGHRHVRSTGPQAWIAELWLDVLGAEVTGRDDDFFDLGGGSLTAAQIVSRLRDAASPRSPSPTSTSTRRSAALAATLDELAAPAARAPTAGSARPRQDPGRPARLHRPAADRSPALRWLTWLALGNNRRGRRCSASTLAAHRLAGGGCWSAGCCWSSRPAGCRCAPPGARVLLRRGRPGRLPARRQGAPAAVARRAARRRAAAPPTWPGRPGCPTYARAARRQGRQGRRPALASRRSPGCSRSATAARSSPRSTSPATGSTATCCTSGAIRVGARARVGTRSMLCPGAAVGTDAEVAPGSAVLGTVPDGRVLVRLAGRARHGAARGPWSPSRPRRKPVWVRRVRRWSRAGHRPAAGRWPSLAGLAVALPVAADADVARRRRAPVLLPLAAARSAGRAARARAADRRPSSGCSRLGLRAGRLPGPQPAAPGRPGPRCGCSTRRAPGCSRSTPAR